MALKSFGPVKKSRPSCLARCTKRGPEVASLKVLLRGMGLGAGRSRRRLSVVSAPGLDTQTAMGAPNGHFRWLWLRNCRVGSTGHPELTPSLPVPARLVHTRRVSTEYPPLPVISTNPAVEAVAQGSATDPGRTGSLSVRACFNATVLCAPAEGTGHGDGCALASASEPQALPGAAALAVGRGIDAGRRSDPVSRPGRSG